ncbi:MAG: HlyD family secretion protein, partial [Sphingomonas oligoaromativorans]
MADQTESQTANGKRTKRISPGTKRILLIALGVVAVLILLWLVHYETRGKYVEGTDDAYIRADAVTVSPKISGYVEQVFVADNQDVKAG